MVTTELDLKARVLAILERHTGHRNAIKGMDIARLCDLRDEPHGWLMPQAVKVTIIIEGD